MPTETVTITIGAGSANQQTKTVTMNVDPATGKGNTTFTYTGANGGQDTITATATIAGTTYNSNSAFVGWQATNGAVSLLTNLTIRGCDKPNHSATGWTGLTGTIFGTRLNQNTVVVNQVDNNTPISGTVTDDGNSGEYKHRPPMVNEVKSDGTAVSTLGDPMGWGQSQPAGSDGAFCTFFLGNLVVKTAGPNTFYFLVDDAYAFYIGGGASVTSNGATSNFGGSPAVPTTASGAASGSGLANVGAWPIVSVRNTDAAGATNATNYCFLTFPSPGIYPFLVWWTNNNDNQTYMQMTYTAGVGVYPNPAGGGGNEAGVVIKPVAPQPTPPATTPNASGLSLSLAQSNLQIQGQSITVNVAITGVVYSTKQYIPVWEGTPGKLFIYNDTNQWVFQQYNGQNVDKVSAATNVFKLSGDNTSWNGLLSVVYNDASDGNFSLKYGGASFPAGIAGTTQLAVEADDIAWFNSTAKTYDLFHPSTTLETVHLGSGTITRVAFSGGGAITFGIEVDWMTKPSSVAVSPNTNVPADGQQHVFTVTLNKPMPPTQYGANNVTTNQVFNNTTATGGVVVNSVTQNINGSGFLTGYTVKATIPTSSVNGSFNLNTVLTGTLTYLNGTAFTVNGSVSYLNVSSPVTTVGVNFIAPVGTACTTSPGNLSAGASQTLTGKFYTFDSAACTCIFKYKEVSSGTTVTIGTGTLQSTTTSTISGQTAFNRTFTFTGWLPPNDEIPAPNNTIYLGFTATDTASTLSTTYFPTTTYTLTPLIIVTCFTFNTLIKTPKEFFPIGLLPQDKPFEIVNETGTHLADLIVHEDWDGLMIDFGNGQMVTLDHLIKDGDKWIEAGDKYPDLPRVPFHGTVYNLHIHSDNPEDHHYVLASGDIAHNAKATCFTSNVEIMTPEGLVAFADLPRDEVFDIINKHGVFKAKVIYNEFAAGWFLDMGDGKLVTTAHKMEMTPGRWVRAEEMYPELPRVWYEGPVYNLHILNGTERDHHYILFNGDVAHNAGITLSPGP